MEQTTTGSYRVLPGRDGDEWLLLDVESGDPTYVSRSPADGRPERAERSPADGRSEHADRSNDGAPALAPGNRVDATLQWVDGDPHLAAAEVVDPTRFHFVRTTETMFEAARRCWETATEQGSGMNSRVTYGTDGEPNGVVYTFAKQPGQRDLFEEFRDGVKPLEPLLVRAAGGREAYENGGDESNEGADPPFAVFVIDAAEEPFVAVYIVLDPDGFLAETVADTYLDGEGGGGGLADRL
jgi:hypothetical protein